MFAAFGCFRSKPNNDFPCPEPKIKMYSLFLVSAKRKRRKKMWANVCGTGKVRAKRRCISIHKIYNAVAPNNNIPSKATLWKLELISEQKKKREDGNAQLSSAGRAQRRLNSCFKHSISISRNITFLWTSGMHTENDGRHILQLTKR